VESGRRRWLGFTQPDPEGAHFANMRDAVRAVAEDAGVEAASVRVWVDARRGVRTRASTRAERRA